MEINTAIVAGTGKSGISATKLLVNHGVKVYLFDENKDRDIEAIKEKTGDSELVQIELGELGEDALYHHSSWSSVRESLLMRHLQMW